MRNIVTIICLPIMLIGVICGVIRIAWCWISGAWDMGYDETIKYLKRFI